MTRSVPESDRVPLQPMSATKVDWVGKKTGSLPHRQEAGGTLAPAASAGVAPGQPDASRLGTGGMLTKLQAADLARRCGTTVIIAGGDEPDVLTRLAAGESLGTRFSPVTTTLESRKRYILAGENNVQGTILVDAGAAKALRKGGSLLPVGVTRLMGEFECGDTVKVTNPSGSEIACGLVNFSSGDLALIAGKQSKQIEAILGSDYDEEVIHRDNLVLF